MKHCCRADNQEAEDNQDNPVPSSFVLDVFLEDSVRFQGGLQWKAAVHQQSDLLDEQLREHQHQQQQRCSDLSTAFLKYKS